MVKDDALKIATVMSVTLSVDHRVIDGALGAVLLAAFKAHQEPGDHAGVGIARMAPEVSFRPATKTRARRSRCS